MRVSEIVKITRGKLLSGDPDIDIGPKRISTDSRTIKRGEFFIALKGANFDASSFIKDALKIGASGALAERLPSDLKKSKKVVIKVSDTTKAYQDIAAYHRSRFKVPVIGVTGSNGKTTVKEMIWSVLSSEYEVLKNEGTKNNHIGVPETLLKLEDRHQFCVLELGMNHKGEIRLLGGIAKPTIAVITNIGPSHLEFLRSLSDVYEAKREILEFLNNEGLAILNGDDAFLSKVKAGRFKVIKFGFERVNDIIASDISAAKNRISFTVSGRDRFELNLLGVHNVYNALAAIVIGTRFGISYESIKEALARYRPGRMRLNIKKVEGINIINDAYNSNPLSMRCALEALKRYPAGARWVVAGDMLELGDRSADFHEAIGEEIAASGIDGLLTFGKFSRRTLTQARNYGMDKKKTWHCSSHEEAARILKKVARRGDVILVKGSRGMKMEKVVDKLS